MALLSKSQFNVYVMIVRRLCTAPSHTTWTRTTISALSAQSAENHAVSDTQRVLPQNIGHDRHSFIYERHVEWMSERVLQHVLADLRPLILPKLNAEADAHLGPGGPANAKRGTLDVHRGDTYQFGYFLRGTEPHAVLIKARTFHAAPPRARAPRAAPSAQPKKKAPSGATGKKRKPKPKPRGKGKGKAKAADDDDAISITSEEEDVDFVPAEPLATRRPKRARKVAAGGYAEDADEDMVDNIAANAAEPSREPQLGEEVSEAAKEVDHPLVAEQLGPGAPVHLKVEEAEPSLADMAPPPQPIDIDDAEVAEDEPVDEPAMDVVLVDEEEEVKPKPILKLSYHGFNIHGRCICVIVEPWPPLRSGTRAPSLAPMGIVAPRAPSIAPADFVPSGGAGQRARTPLFLPDFDREPTPAPVPGRNLPPVPLFNESVEGSDDEDGEMVLFSQLLMSVGDHPPGIAEDDDEIDGAVFFGDADEMREL
ncbi:hypothetical protein VTO73DRAFT_14981 [Trametes versicolor]